MSEHGKPEIEYPCSWEYKTIGKSQEQMRTAIVAIMEDREYTLAESNHSRGGKYCSLLLTTVVHSEEHRNTLFRTLQDHADILMVL